MAPSASRATGAAKSKVRRSVRLMPMRLQLSEKVTGPSNRLFALALCFKYLLGYSNKAILVQSHAANIDVERHVAGAHIRDCDIELIETNEIRRQPGVNQRGGRLTEAEMGLSL